MKEYKKIIKQVSDDIDKVNVIEHFKLNSAALQVRVPGSGVWIDFDSETSDGISNKAHRRIYEALVDAENEYRQRIDNTVNLPEEQKNESTK